MTNDQILMTKEFQMTNVETADANANDLRTRLGASSFVILSSFVIRHSSFSNVRLPKVAR